MTKTLLHLGQDFFMDGITSIKNVGQAQILLAQTIQKVLCKDPSHIAIDSFLQRQLVGLEKVLEWCGRQTEDKGSFLDDLMNRLLNRDLRAVRHRVQIETKNSDTIRELFCLESKNKCRQILDTSIYGIVLDQYSNLPTYLRVENNP